MKCICRPRLTHSGELQKPNPSAVRNTHNERDLNQDAAWTTVITGLRFALRQRRATEIIAVDQVEGVRFVEIQTHGTATTRLAADSPEWRLTYTDQDGRTHVLQFEGGVVSDDGRWVTINCRELL